MINPERNTRNVKRIRHEIQDVFKDAGLKLPTKVRDDLVEVCIAECVELRERIAQRIIGQLIERGDGLTNEQLERLAYIVEFHLVAEDGGIDVIEPPGPKGLQAL